MASSWWVVSSVYRKTERNVVKTWVHIIFSFLNIFIFISDYPTLSVISLLNIHRPGCHLKHVICTFSPFALLSLTHLDYLPNIIALLLNYFYLLYANTDCTSFVIKVSYYKKCYNKLLFIWHPVALLNYAELMRWSWNRNHTLN